MAAAPVAAAASVLSSPPPAVTDATASSEEELHEAIAFFLPNPPSTLTFKRAEGGPNTTRCECDCSAASPSPNVRLKCARLCARSRSLCRFSAGVNNKCTFVSLPADASGNRVEYLLRIYNNGNNSARVDYEHAVLKQLSAASQFSFALPVPLPLLQRPESTVALLKSGASACLFPRIPGGAADASSPAVARSIGRATAELVRGMANLRIDLPLPNPLYRNMYDAHHYITESTFRDLITGPRCDPVRKAAQDLMHELDQCDQTIARIVSMDPPLPEHQVHADLHVSNVLIGESAAAADGSSAPIVTGVLDFEFSAVDWRIMEMVVGLSKYIATASAETCFEAYVDGYAEAGGRLTEAEADLTPDLIVVRVLNNVIYFAGRALAGEDSLDALTTRMAMYAARCAWIREKAPWMRQVLRAKLVDGAEQQPKAQ